MMKSILVIILLLTLQFSVSAFAWQSPFGKPKECLIDERICYHRIKVSENVVLVFKGGCETLEHVGIIFNKNRRILQLDDDLDIISDQKLRNDDVFEDTLEKTFPNTIGVDYKMYDEKSIDD